MSTSIIEKVRRHLDKNNGLGNKGQVTGAGATVIGLLIIVALAAMILMFTTAVNVKTYTAVTPMIADATNTIDANTGFQTLESDINGTVEAGFDATNTVAEFQSVIFLALLASIVIVIFLGFLAMGGGKGGGSISF